MGYSVQQSSAIFGFQASLSSLTTVGGILNVYPIQNSAIIYLQFSIILVKASTFGITMKFISNNLYYLALSSSNFPSSKAIVNLDKNFTSDTYNYVARAFISSLVISTFIGGQ
jgi:hypothetical protein